MMANDLAWGTEEGEGFIECALHHSKTAFFTKDMVTVDKSVDGPDFRGALEGCIQALGLPIIRNLDEHHTEYYVCRVCLESITPALISILDSSLQASSDPALSDVRYRGWLKERISERQGAEDDLLRFVNVAGGPSWKAVDQWTLLLSSRGLLCTTTAGPLLRATRQQAGAFSAKVQRVTHMPLGVSQAGKLIKELIEAGHALYLKKVRAKEMLPDADTEKIVQAKWASHSCRRGGTRKAQKHMGVSGATGELIDMHFRWRSKAIKKKMQNHYGGIKPRLWRLKVTTGF